MKIKIVKKNLVISIPVNKLEELLKPTEIAEIIQSIDDKPNTITEENQLPAPPGTTESPQL